MDWRWRAQRAWLVTKRSLHRGGWCQKRTMVTLLFVLAVIALVGKLLFSAKIVCSNWTAEQQIRNLCDKYKQGEILGDLCPDFCQDPTQIVVESCQTQHFGKEVVFEAKWKGSIPVFVKSLAADHSQSEQLQPVFTIGSNGEKMFPDVPDFDFMVEKFLEDNYGLPTQGNLMEKLWNLPLADDANDDAYIHRAMVTVWALVQDNEYVFSQLYKHLDVFPEVYGSCGSFYIVEKVEPLPKINYFNRPSFDDWSQKVELAIKLLDLIEELEALFDEPAFICDVKLEHFGMSGSQRMKLLDVDGLHLKPLAEQIVGSDAKCTAHSDCNYFDCRGRCDLIEGKCANEITNNNLQMICEDILFGSGTGPLGVLTPGLLSSKHMHSKLRSLLKQCANPSDAKDGTRIRAEPKLRTELFRMLKEISNISSKIKIQS